MKEQYLKFIKEKYKWRFIWTDIFVRYLIVIALLCFIFTSILLIYSISENKKITPFYLLFYFFNWLFNFLFYFKKNRQREAI